jgi:ABC-type branched-subunit amino acid transport system ATPase component/ABC-type branched-subunit amino acid transport system permease subunit
VRGRGVWQAVALVALLLFPIIPGVPFDMVGTANLAFEYSIVALSIVLLIGLVGQISLCQGSFVGMGAFVSALMTRRFGVHMPLTLLVGLGAGAVSASVIGIVALRVRGLYLAVATLIFAYVCDRYLFIQPGLVENQSGTSIPPEVIGHAGTYPSFDLADGRMFYYLALAGAAFALYTVANLRDSRIGRAFAAVRGSEVAAASLGIDVVRYKLLGFACAGALAGLGGSITLVGQRAIAPEQFAFIASLYFLSIAVVGGLRSLGGAVASSTMFALLVGEAFYRSPKLADYLDVISGGLLIAVLLFFRGGLGSVPERAGVLWTRLQPHLAELRRRGAAASAGRQPLRVPVPAPALRVVSSARTAASRVQARASAAAQPVLRIVNGGRSRGASDAAPATAQASPIDVVGFARMARPEAPPPTVVLTMPVPDRTDDAAASADDARLLLQSRLGASQIAGAEDAAGRRTPVLLAAEHVTVRFGGLVAVNDAHIKVGAGEIVGLIGPNGAGKTTLFNSLLGLNSPTSGRVELFGEDVTEWPVHRRAALGVGRTFQILQLFGDLTVTENLMVATHLQNSTGLMGSLVVTPSCAAQERAARERVAAVLELMDLQRFADRRVAGLPFGVLRLVEVARTLVTGARLVCFDEPASGLDSAETERLIEWFRLLRQMGVTLLVIEHDVSMVVRLCDYIYVLNQGELLAEGPPAQIQRDPQVVASYLGTSLEAAV